MLNCIVQDILLSHIDKDFEKRISKALYVCVFKCLESKLDFVKQKRNDSKNI